MREVAEKKLGNELGFISINGTAENTTLENESIDYITAAQSFHWFDRL
jgi:ubiquinone/menaquinone biosynthesis C-methylase UbiE